MELQTKLNSQAAELYICTCINYFPLGIRQDQANQTATY